MNIRVHSSDLSRMMKVLANCTDARDEKKSNVEIRHEDSGLFIRATNGVQFVSMRTPLLGGDGETICVDGKMLNSAASIQRGDVEIRSEGNSVMIKGNGRIRLPKVSVDLPEPPKVKGKTAQVKASELMRAVEKVSYAVATDESRVVLTGILMEVENNQLKLVALDGFQMSIESVDCEGDGIRVIVPAVLMNRICSCAVPDDTVTIVTDGHNIRFSVDGAEVVGTLLSGDFIDYQRILPKGYVTEVLFRTDDLRTALRSSQAICDARVPIKIEIHREQMDVKSNSEVADFEAEVGCQTSGNELTIAFNAKYIQNALNVIDNDNAVIRMNSAVSPAVIYERDGKGIRLFLPVRV